MKPLKVTLETNNGDVTVFMRPDIITVVIPLKSNREDACGIEVDSTCAYHGMAIIVKEPILEFAARWQLSLM